MSQYKRVIILLADGSRPDVMNEQISAGNLPAIKKYLVDPGTITDAVTAFPSTTGPAYIPFLTGCLPATSNVPGIRWIDKVRFAKSRWHSARHRSYVGLETYLIGSDMRRELPTLFELLPKSYNIFNSVNRGVSFRRNMTRICRIWYWYYAHLTDRWDFVDKTGIKKFSRALKKDFDMIFMVMPGIDEFSHFAHYKHPHTLDAYKTVDNAVEKAHEILSKDGRWDDTLFWIVSDHGLSTTHTHFCVNNFLEDRGIRTLYYPKIFKKNCIAANMMSGNGMTHIYFKHDHGWQYPMYKDDIENKYPSLIDDLLKEDAVDILAYRSSRHVVEVRSKKGEAHIELEGENIRYVVHGSDPFGYSEMNEHLTADEAFDHTIDTEYPDAAYQLAHLFTSPRCGDIVISAAKGYDLRDEHEVPEHKGSHGSLHRDHMKVPLICNAKINPNHVRTVDVFPTTLNLLGHPTPANIDGKVL